MFAWNIPLRKTMNELSRLSEQLAGSGQAPKKLELKFGLLSATGQSAHRGMDCIMLCNGEKEKRRRIQMDTRQSLSLSLPLSASSTGSPPPSRLDICCLATPAPIGASGLSSPLQWNQPCMQMADAESSRATVKLYGSTQATDPVAAFAHLTSGHWKG